MLNYETVRNWDFGEIVHEYSRRDAMLYALSIGMGANPLDAGELRFAYEKNLQAVPTMATVLGSPGFWWPDPRSGVDWVKLVHGEQHLNVLKPLLPSTTVVARNRVVSLTDKGPGKGALAVIMRELYDKATGDLLTQSSAVSVLRGDGGFSEQSGKSDPGPAPLPAVPERAADIEVELATTENQALIYRLNGDYNLIHSDPEVAQTAGFHRPVLHGLCTYGMAAHAVLKCVCDYDAARIRGLSVRFTAPVFPGRSSFSALEERCRLAALARAHRRARCRRA